MSVDDTSKLVALGKSAVAMAFDVDTDTAAMGRRVLTIIVAMSTALHDGEAARVRALLEELDDALSDFVSELQSVDDAEEAISRAVASGWYSRGGGDA